MGARHQRAVGTAPGTQLALAFQVWIRQRESRTRRTANRFSTAARLCLKPTKAIGPAWQVAAFLFNFFLHLSVMFFNFLCSGQFIPSAVS